VASSAAILLLVVGGLAASTLLISREARRAEENLNLALAALEQTLAESVAGELIIEPNAPKRDELAQRGIRFYEEFARKNGVDPHNWTTYRVLLCNQQLSKALSLRKTGRHAETSQAFEKAIDQARQLMTDANAHPIHRARLAGCLGDYSTFLNDIGRTTEAERYCDASGELIAILVEKFPEDPEYRYLLGLYWYNRGIISVAARRTDLAEFAYAQAIMSLEKAIRAQPDVRVYRYILAQSRYNLGLVLSDSGQHVPAGRVWNQALADWRALVQEFPRNSEHMSRVGATLSNLAILARDRGESHECRKLAEQALVAQKRALAIKPPYELCRDFLRGHYKVLAQALWRLEDHTSLAAISEERIKLLPDVPWEYFAAAGSLGLCAEILQAGSNIAQDHERTDHYCQRALEILAGARERFQSVEAQVLIADAYVSVGDSFKKAKRHEAAQQAWQVARGMFATLSKKRGTLTPAEIDKRTRSVDERLHWIGVPPPATPDITFGLIGYWQFDGDGSDASPFDRDLTLQGNVRFASGLVGQALDMHKNQSTYAVRSADDVAYDFGDRDFTIQAWVNYYSVSTEQVLIEKFTGTGGAGWSFTKPASNVFQFFATGQHNSSPQPISLNEWHHLLVRRGGYQIQIWRDGQRIADARIGTIASSVTPLYIGRRNPDDKRDFGVNGRLDEVAIWNRALSDSEIAHLYNGGLGNPVATVPSDRTETADDQKSFTSPESE
jgi:tetratricopeptide (TPR) repeat protein